VNDDEKDRYIATLEAIIAAAYTAAIMHSGKAAAEILGAQDYEAKLRELEEAEE
jgi:hypothetical protein